MSAAAVAAWCTALFTTQYTQVTRPNNYRPIPSILKATIASRAQHLSKKPDLGHTKLCIALVTASIC
jgi:hypothetical protein